MIPPPPPLVHISRLTASSQLDESGPPSVPASEAAASSDASLDDVPEGIEIPEGVDPSFLAALPQEIRAEVLSEHLRLVLSLGKNVLHSYLLKYNVDLDSLLPFR